MRSRSPDEPEGTIDSLCRVVPIARLLHDEVAEGVLDVCRQLHGEVIHGWVLCCSDDQQNKAKWKANGESE